MSKTTNPNPIIAVKIPPDLEPDCLGCGSLDLKFKGKQLGKVDNDYYWIYNCNNCNRENPIEVQLI